jgi:outer membrane lipoprotein
MRYLILLLMLAGCASTPKFDTSQVDQSLTPQAVNAEPLESRGKSVLWGGTILDTRNLEDSTQIELLAYPLNSSQRPIQASKPLGRFIIRQTGYLEPATYAQGRLLTVLGSVGDSQLGKVGEASYNYPVIIAEKLQLWTPESESSKSTFHFGIGIGF